MLTYPFYMMFDKKSSALCATSLSASWTMDASVAGSTFRGLLMRPVDFFVHPRIFLAFVPASWKWSTGSFLPLLPAAAAGIQVDTE